jgi:hypothetical protein
MKRFALLVLPIALIAVEVLLVAALLPRSWMPATIVNYARNDNPNDPSLVTHPAMEYEVDQAIQRWPWLKPSFTLLVVLLIAGNARLIYRLCQNLRTRRTPSDSN